MLEISREDDSFEHHFYVKLYYLLLVQKKRAVDVCFDMVTAKPLAPLIYKVRLNM